MLRSWFQFSFSVALMLGLSLVASSAFAQPGGGRGPGGGGFGGGFGGPGGGGALGLLQNEDVKKELDLVDDQVEKLTAIGEKQREEMRGLFGGLRDLSEDERRARFEELRSGGAARQEELQKQIDEILLPQQKERLAQIQFQQSLRTQGSNSTGLTSDAAVKALNISDEQKAKLEELEKEVGKEIADKVAKARAEAREKLLAALTPEQREQFKKLVGTEFRFTQTQGRGFGQGGQGGPGTQQRGGEGGQRGGGQRGGGQRGGGNRGI